MLDIPTALTTEAAATLLSGDVIGIKAVQDKIAVALAGQGVSGDAASGLADGWVRSFAAGVGASASPDGAIAEAGRQVNGAAARMAQAVQDAATLTADQRLATALAQGQDIASSLGTGGGSGGAIDPALVKALFAGVMGQPTGSIDPVAALSQALAAPQPPTAADTVILSPAEKLASALASGVAVSDTVKALGADASGVFAQGLEKALSSGADVSAAIATAADRAAQVQDVAVPQSGGDRLLTALAAGGPDVSHTLGAIGTGNAFTGVLNDRLAQGTAPDAALGQSTRAQAETATMQRGAEVAQKPADLLVASLASGRDVAETVKSFAVSAGIDPADAGGFGRSLGAALSAGTDAAGALGVARQDVAATTSLTMAAAQGVKADALVTALASGQNVQQSVQALGGAGAFGAALGQALAEGRSPGQAVAAARQVAETVQRNGESTEVPVSPENKALADLATPQSADAAEKGADTEQVAEKAEQGKDEAGAKAEEKAETEKDAEQDGEKAAETGEAGEKASEKAVDKADAKEGKEGEAVAEAPASDKSLSVDGGAFKAAGFSAPDSGAKADSMGSGSKPGTASPTAGFNSAAPTAKVTASTDRPTTTQVTQTVERILATETVPAPLTPTLPTDPATAQARAPILAAGFDAAALAAALALAEGTAAPAGFTVFHLIEAMFRPGETSGSVIGVAVVANPGSALGVWQYSVDVSTWQAVGAVGDGAALTLAGNAMLRFLPVSGAFGTAPALGLRALNEGWAEGFSGSGRTLFALGETGGTSPSSAEVGSLSLLVTPVNDAPVTSGTAVALAPIAEDTAAPAGSTVSALFAALFSDPADAVNGAAGDGFAGVVVVADAASATQGEWQYWNGAAWTAVGAVSEASGLLLGADAKLRFLPAADWNGTTPALSVRLIDDSAGSVITGARADLSGGAGAATRYSAETIALTQSVTAVNDAPVATGTSVTLAATAEDSADPAGSTVSALFAPLFSDAKDMVNGSSGDAFAGIAIVGNAASSTQGSWQYWNGSAWTAIDAVSDGSALVVTAVDKLRFVPAPDWNGTVPALNVRLIDGSVGVVASGDRVDLTGLGVGGAAPFSAALITLTTSVTAMNDAPLTSGTAVALSAIAEDTAAPSGATVSALFAALFSDPADAVAGGSAANSFAGVVVVADAASTVQGAWQYWNGTAWTAVGAVSEASGLLLGADAKLRFLPAADWNGTTPALSVRLVDDSGGSLTTGARADLSGGAGAATRYSAETIALTQSVSAVNDAPVATAATVSLDAIAEDSADPAGSTVTTLFASLFSDAADAADAVAGGSVANGFAGIAIVGNAASGAQGVWHYWNGTAWVDVGSVTAATALLVEAAGLLRFVPAADWNVTNPALTVRLIDGSGGAIVSGDRIDLTAGVGGATAYSAATIDLTGSVTAVNDAPILTASTASLSTVTGVAVAVTGLSVADIDAGTEPLLVTLTAGHGALTLDGGGLDAVITGNGTDSVTVRATLDTINTLLGAANGLLYTASSYSGTDTLTVTVDDLGGGGSGGALTDSATVTVTVAPPNASPILTDTNLVVAVAAEALAAPASGTAGIAVSQLVGMNGSGPGNVTDGDSGAVTGIALVGTNEDYGDWWFSTDGGASWSLVGTVNDSDSALLLRSTDRLYFQPDAAVPASVSAALTIRAWDQTSGIAGARTSVDTTAGSAFSSATDSVTLHPGVLVPNGSFDDGLTGWSFTGGASVGSGGDGKQGSITSAAGQAPTALEDFLGLTHGSIATATGTTPSLGHAMKLSSTVTVTQDTTLTFDWSFTFADNASYFDFGFVTVNGVTTLLAKAASASGTFSTTLLANTTLSLGFGASDTGDNSVNPILKVDNIKLTKVASDPILLDLTGDGLSLRPLSDNVHFDVTGDGVTDRTGWIGPGNALLARDTNHDGRIDGAQELVSEKFGAGFNSSLEALASLDDNHDGRLDATDAAYGGLLVWQDADADGVSRPDELRSLAEAGIRSIATAATTSDMMMAGNRILGTTSMTMADGATHAVAGVAFAVEAAVNTVVRSQPVESGHGGADFAAMLNNGLGLPNAAPVVQDMAGVHGLEWFTDAQDPNAHHPQTHAAYEAPPPAHA